MIQTTDTEEEEDTGGDVLVDVTETASEVEVAPLPFVHPPSDTIITQSSMGDGDKIQNTVITKPSRG